MLPRRFASALALALLLFSPKLAQSAENGSVVSGVVQLPAQDSRRASPRRGQGFVPRAKNHLRPPNGFNPRSRMVIVLDGGPVDETDKQPKDAHYDIIGENFQRDILPVIVGGKIQITNQGRKAPRLYSTILPSVVPGDPINKTGGRETQAIAEAHKEIDLRDHNSVHFLAHIVAFEHGYFSTVAADGSFSIAGVPAGTWKVKVWHKGGWVTNIPDVSVTVVAKRESKGVTIALPVRLSKGEASE